MMAKDYFSEQSAQYAKFRPTYPQELFDYVLSFVKNKQKAWDCATGNGQAANVLAHYFTTVEATDISEAQLGKAVRKENIHYSISAAESTPFATDNFDLITVATAYHWFNWPAFFKEATRVGKVGCVVAVWAYNLLIPEDEAVRKAIDYCYVDLVGAYWHRERDYVRNNYETIPFDFAPLPCKRFIKPLQWTKEELLGYFSSWSATANYTRQVGESPLPQMKAALEAAWPGDDRKDFRLPLFLRLGRVTK